MAGWGPPWRGRGPCWVPRRDRPAVGAVRSAGEPTCGQRRARACPWDEGERRWTRPSWPVARCSIATARECAPGRAWRTPPEEGVVVLPQSEDDSATPVIRHRGKGAVMSKRTRRRYTPEQKAALVRQHVVDKKPVSEICSTAQLQPSVFYKWERDLLEAAPSVFAGHRAPSREQELEAKIAALEAKLARKDAIIAEVSEEYVRLKKHVSGLLVQGGRSAVRDGRGRGAEAAAGEGKEGSDCSRISGLWVERIGLRAMRESAGSGANRFWTAF